MRSDLEYRSIPRMALINAERYGDAVAVLDGDISLSFQDVGDQMVAVGRSLLASGVTPGDRVALWAPNSAAWITTALGILSIGARLVPLNTRFKGREAAYILTQCRARTLVAVDGFLGLHYVDMLREADASVPALADVVILDGPGVDGTSSWETFIARGSTIEPELVHTSIESIRPEDGSDVIFTSGTTGHPKGVMLRHGTSLRCYAAYNASMQLGPGDRMLVVTPFFHCFGYKAGWMAALMLGATTVPMAVFDASEALDMIERLRITHTAGAPTMFWAMIDDPSLADRNITSLRRAVASAAYVPVELIERMKSDLGIDQPLTGYGLTEAHAIVSISQADEPADIVATWSGQVLKDVEVRIVDDAGQDVPVGERGELLVRGYSIMDGYFDDPVATAAVIDPDGWLHTGDVAYLNADNYLKVCDRKRDMYVTGGFNVAPAEVESIITDWDLVGVCAVIGVNDDRWGEVGAAFVVPARGVALTADDVVAYSRERMAKYKVPRRISIVTELPVNATGKVQKNVLREWVADGIT